MWGTVAIYPLGQAHRRLDPPIVCDQIFCQTDLLYGTPERTNLELYNKLQIYRFIYVNKQ